MKRSDLINKILKITALTVVIVVLALSACSCKAIDNLKDSVVTVSDDRNTVTFKGKEYALLTNDINVAVNSDTENVYVNEGDVPLLLMAEYCAEGTYYSDADCICMSYLEDDPGRGKIDLLLEGHRYAPESYFYCPADRVKEYEEKIDPENMTCFCTCGYAYDYDVRSSDSELLRFSDKTCPELEKIMDELPEKGSNELLQKLQTYEGTYYAFDLWKTSPDGFFIDPYYEFGVSVFISEDEKTFFITDEKISRAVTVPDSLYGEFKRIYDKCCEYNACEPEVVEEVF